MYRTFFLSSLLLSGTILSSHASPLGTIDEAEHKFEEAPQYRSFPSKLNFESAAGRTGAGILHYADGPDGPYILLGLRDDEDSWCNFGGMSDAQEGELAGLLAKTAAREVEEESNGYFAHHPHDVKALPFIDTLADRKGESFLYRMYFKKVPMVGAEHLKKAQEESTSHHNQEYKDFRWVPAKAIWDAIQNGTQDINLGEEAISLYAPLFATLMTPAGQALLGHVTAFSRVNRFSKDLRPFLSRVYNVQSESREDYSEAVKFSEPQVGPHSKPLQSEFDQAQLSYAVAAHGAAMTELKSKFKVKPEKDPVDEIPVFTGWNDNPNLSLSQIHLRMVLGHDYKTAEDFKNAENPQRAANKANIEEYLKRYAGTDEFRRPATHTPHDVNILADVLEFEEKNKSKPTFYHAANSDVNNLWQSFTFLRELLSMTPMVGEKVVMRGTDIYFKDVKTMLDILNKYGYDDYQGRELLVLCANYVLMAGLKTTNTSSSSVEYLLNDHSVITPNIEAKFEEATALAGIVARYSYYKSLFLQYLAHQNPEGANSVMVGISVPPELLGAHSYAAYGGGTQYNVYDGTNQTNKAPTVIELLKGIQAEGEMPVQSFEDDKSRKTQLIPEARLNLHPDFALHPDVEMKAFNRFPLSQSQQKDFEREMRTTTIATLADWLKSQYQVMPDSFQNYPLLKKLYAFVWKGVTGEDIEETFAYESFTHLLANGHIEGARDFLTKYPEVKNHEGFDPKAIAQAVIRINKLESFKFLLDEVVHKTVAEFYVTPKDYYIAIRTALCFENHEFLDYLLGNYDLTAIPSNIVTSWFNMEGDETDSHRFVLAKHFPEFKERARREALKTLHGPWILSNIVDYIKFTDKNPSQIVRDILKASSPQKVVFYSLLDILKLAEIDLSELTAADFDEFTKNEYISSQDQADLLLSKGLKPSVLLGITMTHCADKGCNLPDWVFDVMKRDGLDVESLSVPLRNVIQKLYLSNDQINALIAGGIVSTQTVIDWMSEKNVYGSFLSFLESLSSLDVLALKARLNPSVLLEITVNHCAEKGYSLPEWFFAFMERDDLDVESLKTPLKRVFQKFYLSMEQVNHLISRGFVTAQNVIDWKLEREGLCFSSFVWDLRGLSSLDPIVLSAENQTQLGALLARSTYISNSDIDYLLNCGMSPLILAKSMIGASTLEGSSVNYELGNLIGKHPEVLAEIEVQEMINLLKVCYLSNEVFSKILSSVKDRDALIKAVEAAECKNSQEMYRLFRFAQAAELDPRKISGFDMSRLFESNIYLCESDLEFITKNGFHVLDVFKAALTSQMLENSYWALSQFVRNHMVELKDELTEAEKNALEAYNNDVFIASIKERYQIADVPEVVIPEPVVQELPIATVETPPDLWQKFKEFKSNYRPAKLQVMIVPMGPGGSYQSLETEDGEQLTSEVSPSEVVSIDWDSLHGDELLKTLKGTYHGTMTGFVGEFKGRIDQIKSSIAVSQEPEIVRGMMADLLALDDEELSLNALQKAYPNRDDFMGLEFTPLKNGSMWSKPLQFVISQYGGGENVGPFPNSLKAILDYLGDNLPQYFQNDPSSFAPIISNLAENNEDALRQLWTQCPDLFTFKDEENDFFDKALEILDGPILDEFALHFQHKLKELSLDGVPYFWSAVTKTGKAADEMIAYVAENPDVLELKSLDGISLEEYLCDVMDQRAQYEKGLKELTAKLRRGKK